MNFRKRKAGPAHLETSPQRTTKETTSRPDIPSPNLSSNANTTNQEVSVTTMDIDRHGVVKSNTSPGSPPPPYSSPYPQQNWKGPKHLDPYAPGESIHPGLGALKTKTDATKFPSAPKFPPRTSSLGLPGVNTNLTNSKILKTAPLNTTSPTSEYSSPRDYIRSSLSNIKEEKEEATSINATVMDWQIDALFPSDDFKPEFDDNVEDSPPEASSNDKINSWLAKSFQNYSKPVDGNDNSKIGPSFPSYSKSVEEKDNSKIGPSFPSYSKSVEEKDNIKIGPTTLKKDSEKQSTSKRRASKLSNEHSTSDGDSNDAGSENSTIKPPSFILPKGLDEPEDTGVKIYWDGSIWPPENKHEKMKIEEICRNVALARGFTEVVIMSRVITCLEKKVFYTVRRIYYEPHIKAVFSKPPHNDDFYPTKNVKKSNTGSIVRRYNLRKPSTKASFDHQEVVQEVALVHVGPNAEGVANWDPEEKEGWEQLGMWRKGGKEIIQWNVGYDHY